MREADFYRCFSLDTPLSEQIDELFAQFDHTRVKQTGACTRIVGGNRDGGQPVDRRLLDDQNTRAGQKEGLLDIVGDEQNGRCGRLPDCPNTTPGMKIRVRSRARKTARRATEAQNPSVPVDVQAARCRIPPDNSLCLSLTAYETDLCKHASTRSSIGHLKDRRAISSERRRFSPTVRQGRAGIPLRHITTVALLCLDILAPDQNLT